MLVLFHASLKKKTSLSRSISIINYLIINIILHRDGAAIFSYKRPRLSVYTPKTPATSTDLPAGQQAGPSTRRDRSPPPVTSSDKQPRLDCSSDSGR